MFKPLSVFLALRYVRSRHGNGFSSFISASSTIGIALGTLVLIVSLSTMNGFERELAKKLLSIVPHAELLSVNEPISDWPAKVAKLHTNPHVIAAAPVISLSGMLQHKNNLKAVEIRGVEPRLETQVSAIADYMVSGTWQDFIEHNEQAAPGIILGAGVAKKLSVELGDSLQMLLPSSKTSSSTTNNSAQQLFAAPIKKYVQVIGIFKFGGTIDETLAYISLPQAASIKGYQAGEVHGVRLTVTDVFAAPAIARQMAYQFDHYVYIMDWTRSQGHLFNDIQLVRMIMFIALVLVIAVASFNIVSTLIMAVNEKQGDIAILKTMGAPASVIMLTFVYQGLVNGILGSLIGGILGGYLSLYLADITVFFEQLFSMKFLSADVYFIDKIPSELDLNDVYITVITALLMSLLATIYPAWRATKVEPAQVLGQQ